jgi:hypothetical protein
MKNIYSIVQGVLKQYILSQICSLLVLMLLILPAVSYGLINDLRSNGFSLIPAPQKTELTGQIIVVDNSWAVDAKLDANSIIL